MSHIITKEKMIDLVTRNDEIAVHAIGRCLVNLLNRQTQSEAQANTTSVDNMQGFTPADAKSGCITAKYYIKHKSLLDWQLERWQKPNVKGVPRIAKYWKQMDDVAKEKLLTSAN